MTVLSPQVQKEHRDLFLRLMQEEIDRAYAKHGTEQWGRHEFYGILAEEFRELEEAIFHDDPMVHVIAEAVQVAAMCLRYYETGDRYGWREKKT